jgi:alpha-L-fucosidase
MNLPAIPERSFIATAFSHASTMKITPVVAAFTLSFLAYPLARAESPAEKTERMQWFNDARFGMFIHWGVYSEAAGNFKGKPVPGAGEWLQDGGKIPAAEYREELLPKFNPVKYDPEAWVIAAKNAGMKYIVITSKHHDGFCLWDSKLTDWDVGSSPHKKDLLKPLADACKKHGIKFCLYHSIMDWSHPDYGTKASWRGNANNPQPDMDRFTAYLKGQLKEIVNDYQPGILWFDGEWEGAWTHERGADLYDYLRKLDSKLIINNRVDKGRAGMHGHTTDSKFKGDYGTPEQEIPATGFGEGVAWESCMTMNGTWGFKTADTGWKSTETLVRNLIDIASKGGNYLLNVGPTGEGEIPAASLEQLAAIGEWMKVNGESIHGTTASLFPKVSWNGRSTTRRTSNGNTSVYLHVFAKPEDGKIAVRGLVNRPESASILGQPGNLEISGKEGAWAIQIPATNPIATVVALTFKGTPEIREIPVGLD